LHTKKNASANKERTITTQAIFEDNFMIENLKVIK
jgi:hypothetical protein